MKSDIRSFYTVKRLSMLSKVTTLRPSANWELCLQACAVSMLNGTGIPAGPPYLKGGQILPKNSVFIGMPV